MDEEKKALKQALTETTDLLKSVSERLELTTKLLEKDRDITEFGKALLADEKHLSMAECAKLANDLLGETIGRTIGRNIFCRYMRTLGIFRSNNEPYQKNVDAGHFVLKMKETNIGFIPVPLATKKGLNYACKKILEYYGHE